MAADVARNHTDSDIAVKFLTAQKFLFKNKIENRRGAEFVKVVGKKTNDACTYLHPLIQDMLVSVHRH